MTDHRFQVAELTLGYQLPAEFWRPYEQQHAKIARVLAEQGESLICASPKELLAMQDGAKEAALCVVDEMVEWWDEFFVIGETGDGGYFFMKRAGSSAVWLLDSDWYDTPQVVCSDLNAFIDSLDDGKLP